MKKIFLLLVISRASFGLIGGQPAVQWTVDKVLATKGAASLEEKIFPSIVLLSMGCTGAVVGPRHILTAAHCVVMDETTRRLKFDMLPGNTLRWDTRAQWTLKDDYNESWSHSAEIVRTFVHPSYVYAALNDNFPESTGDIALIVVDKVIGTTNPDRAALTAEPPLLPIMPIEFEPLDPDSGKEKVVKLGYGCESLSTDGAISSSRWTLKFDANNVLPDQEEALRKAATYQKVLFKEVFDDFYWISKGWFFDETKSATNCPGDSGGPLLTVSSTGIKISGVNSRSRFEGKENGVYRIAIDFHTRLDHDTPLRVDRWLQAALNYPKTGWYQGLTYLSIVPRDRKFIKDGLKVTTKVRDDLYTSSDYWIAFLDGIEGTCPLRFDKVDATGPDADRKRTTVALKAADKLSQDAQFVLPVKGQKFKIQELKLTFAMDENVAAENRSGICFLTFMAKE